MVRVVRLTVFFRNDTNDRSVGLAREAHSLVRIVRGVTLRVRGVSSAHFTRGVVYEVLCTGPNNLTVCPAR